MATSSPQVLERHIVAKGNYPMVPRDQKLFNCPVGRNGEQLQFNVSPGQLVAYVVESGKLPVTIDATDIPNVSGDLYIGVGYDSTGDGLADDVRLIAGEYLSKCQVEDAELGKPSCGSPAIKGTTIDCVNCEDTYTVKVTIDDNRSRSWGPFNKTGAEFIGTYKPDCSTCDDCPVDVNCKEIICGLVDSLNGELDLKLNGKRYPDWKGSGMPRPYKAVVVHENWNTYCIQPDAGDCEDCNKFDAITGATINGNPVTLTGNLDPSDNSKTLIPQLKNIAFQIETAMEKEFGRNAGFAFVSQGITSCCPIQLHVVTCDDEFALAGLTPCPDVINPADFLTFPGKADCADCTGAVPTPYTASCALAVFVDPAKPDCGDCYLDRPWTWYGVNLDVEIIRDAFDYGPIAKPFTIMEATSPRNFGSQIQWFEYKFGIGPAGRGRRHRASNYRRGHFDKFDDTSRIKKAVTAKCEALYCTYFLEHTRHQRSEFGPHNTNYDFRSGIHVNSDDTVTLTAWETFFNALITSENSNCKVIGEVACLA